MDPRMKEAARTGEINTLYALIGEDPYALERLEQVPFVETPLHVAAFEGHINMAMEIFNLKPSFARKLNPDGWSPLHLALRNEQTRLARRLVQTDKQLLRVKGREGMTPFHCVAMEGKSSLLVEFLEACPQCIEDVTVEGETALHLALKGDHFEVFKILLGWLQTNKIGTSSYEWEKKIAKWTDNDGNTVMHIAAINKNGKAWKMLLNSFLPLDFNIKNAQGLTASDIVNNVQRQVINGGNCKDDDDDDEVIKKFKVGPKLYSKRVSSAMARERNSISTETVNMLLVVTTLIITAAYQSCLSPPGGLWQGGDDSDNGDGGGGGGGGGGTNSSVGLVIDTSTTTGFTFGNYTYTLYHRQVKQQGTTIMNLTQFSFFWLIYCSTFASAVALTISLLSKVRCSAIVLAPLISLAVSFHYSLFIISPSTVWSRMNVAVIPVYYLLIVSYCVFTFGMSNLFKLWSSSIPLKPPF